MEQSDVGGGPRDTMFKVLDGGIVVNEFEPSHTIAFTFKQIPLGKVSTPLSS